MMIDGKNLLLVLFQQEKNKKPFHIRLFLPFGIDNHETSTCYAR